MASHSDLANLIWQIADLLRGPYRPPQYERVMLPLVVLRRFDCVLANTKDQVLAEYERRKGGRLEDDALDRMLNKASGHRFHNCSPMTFQTMIGDTPNLARHLSSYISGFSANVRRIFDFFEFTNEIEKMDEANILYLVLKEFLKVDLHPDRVKNDQMGLVFENLIRRFNELANETAGDHFTPREVIHLMVDLLFMDADDVLSKPGTVMRMLDPACGTGGMLAEMRGRAAEPLEQLTTSADEPSPVFFFRGEGFSAEMVISQSGDFVVKAGSKARARTTPTIPKGTLALRETLLKSGVLRVDASTLVFASDYSFTSASAAAATVIGASANGRILWKLADGRCYADWEAEGTLPQGEPVVNV